MKFTKWCHQYGWNAFRRIGFCETTLFLCVLRQHWLIGFTAQGWHFHWPWDLLWDRVLAPVRVDQWTSGQAPSECWCICGPHLASCGTFDSMWLCLLCRKSFLQWLALVLDHCTANIIPMNAHSFCSVCVPHHGVYFSLCNRRRYCSTKHLLSSVIIKSRYYTTFTQPVHSCMIPNEHLLAE